MTGINAKADRIYTTGSLLLASASPRRAMILGQAGLAFSICPAADVEGEAQAVTNDPALFAVELAISKALAVERLEPGGFVLGADTVVVLGDRMLGKPHDDAEAFEILRLLRGRAHLVITGVAVAGPAGVITGSKTTIIRLRRYTNGEISEYVQTGSPLDKAGAYGIQDRVFAPAETVTGCYLNVVGLPLCLTLDLLDQAGAIARSNKKWPKCTRALAFAE